MQKIAMLGSGFYRPVLCRIHPRTRSKDKIVSIYSAADESAKKFAVDYGCPHWTTTMEDSIAHPDVDIVCIAPAQ